MPVLTPQALHQVQSEFAAFLNYSRLAPTVAHGPAITKVFIAANADRNNDEDNDEARLTRFEFFEALLMMAMYRFGRGGVICDGAGQVSYYARVFAQPCVLRVCVCTHSPQTQTPAAFASSPSRRCHACLTAACCQQHGSCPQARCAPFSREM